MATPARAWGRAGAVLVVLLALDQITKALVRSDVALGEHRDLVLGIDLVHIRNRGVAFSALSDQAGLVIAIIAVAVTALVVYFARNATRPLMWLPTGLLVGGAIGNVVDRIARGSVTDFVKLPHWPAFNVADMAITVGVVVLVLIVERNANEKTEAARA